MLNDLLNYTGMASLGLAGLGLTYAHRGEFRYDWARKINVSAGNGISASIIRRFPRYAEISSPLEHFTEGIFLPVAMAGFVGLVQFSAQQLGLDVERDSYSELFSIGWSGTLVSKVSYNIIENCLRRARPTRNDAYQIVGDVSSLAVGFAVFP
jgi:hypothetical protein